MRAVKTWILIADGARARILENDGPGHGLKPVPDCEFEADRLRDQDIDADRPGRAFDSHGQGRHAMEAPTSPARKAKEIFARQLVTHLEKALAKQAFERLVVVAPAKTLGDIRAALPKDLAARLTGELAKDLTKIRNDDMAEHLKDVLAA